MYKRQVEREIKVQTAVEEFPFGTYFDGVTATNSLSIMTGKEKMQTYFSYANTTAKGIVDVNMLQKHLSLIHIL